MVGARATAALMAAAATGWADVADVAASTADLAEAVDLGKSEKTARYLVPMKIAYGSLHNSSIQTKKGSSVRHSQTFETKSSTTRYQLASRPDRRRIRRHQQQRSTFAHLALYAYQHHKRYAARNHDSGLRDFGILLLQFANEFAKFLS